MNGDVYSRADVRSALLRLHAELTRLSTTGDEVLVSTSDSIVVHTRLQLLFNLKCKDPVEARLLEIIMGHCIAAEKMGPGAFDETIKRLLEYLSTILKGQQPQMRESSHAVISRLATRADIETIVMRRLESVNPVTRAIAEEALTLAGFGGRVIVEKTHARVPSVELSRGYSFDVTPAWPVTARYDGARAFVIDGYVEQVSEVHHLLQAASEAREPVVLFLRGLSQDVMHTLRVNMDRGSLNVVPVIVRFDLEGINTVNDIAVVTGCNMISSNKGDLISAAKFEESPRLESVLVYPTKVVIQHSATSSVVKAQVSMLRKKRTDDHVVDDVGKLYDKRIRSLSPNHVIVRLPDDKDFVRSSQAIDVALRTIKTMVDHGINIERGTTAAVEVAAMVHASRCCETLASLGAIVFA